MEYTSLIEQENAQHLARRKPQSSYIKKVFTTKSLDLSLKDLSNCIYLSSKLAAEE